MNDLKFACRQLLKNPGFTAVAVLTLGLGIGANTAIFTVINTLLLRSLPVQKPEELVLLTKVGSEGRDEAFSYPLYAELRDGSHSLSGLFAAGGPGRQRILAGATADGEAEPITGQAVSGNFFSVLGVSALIGRTLTGNDDQAGHPQPVAVISHRFWQRRFGADPSIVGKAITLDGVPFTIVGVTPPSFFGFQVGASPDLWWPMQMVPQVIGDAGRLSEGNSWMRLMGRVPQGASPSKAQAELAVIFQRNLAARAAARGANWTASERKTSLGRKLELQPGNVGSSAFRQQYRQPLLVLMAAVGLVLLIACANIASLLLARASAREREFSLRSALGAGRWQLLRQSLTESALLAALGGVLGLLFAQWGSRLLVTYLPPWYGTTFFDLRPDERVLAFTMTVSLLTGILFGFVPALRSSRRDLTLSLNGRLAGPAGRESLQALNNALVIGQVALSLVLLACAGLFVRTLEKLKSLDTGFQRENVILFELELGKNYDIPRRVPLFKQLLARLESLPGVRAASLSAFGLLSGGGWSDKINVEGTAAVADEDLSCQGMVIGPRFFETLRIALLSGREFGPQDERLNGAFETNTSWTAIINKAMARRFFGEADPIGKHFRIADSSQRVFEIVGVVKDAKYRNLRDPAPPTFYMPFFQRPGPFGMTFELRTIADPRVVMASLRGVVREIDPKLRLSEARTLEDVLNTTLHRERILAQLSGFFSLFALSLACLGIYGVLSFLVVQRTREIGVRVALGAQRHDVLALVIGGGLKLALFGSVLGLAGAFAATRLVTSLLYGVTATDPMTFLGVSLLLLTVAVLASYLPARRAMGVDPMDALRYE